MITVDEAKSLILDETPVIYDGHEYAKINTLIFRKKGSGFSATVEILDKNGIAVVITELKRITVKGAENEA